MYQVTVNLISWLKNVVDPRCEQFINDVILTVPGKILNTFVLENKFKPFDKFVVLLKNRTNGVIKPTQIDLWKKQCELER